MPNFYNEFNPESAAMLRQMMTDGLIPKGVVDERSITEIEPNELKQYTQCHFFAGIGGWSIALRLAGWPDDRPVWTGSCPCQPFSSAGRQKGKTDDRHLWPVWERLISECRPATIFGEQVASAIAHGWLDDVYQGLEAEGYAVGSAVLPACAVGAPHRRDRLWFVANASSTGFSDRREPQVFRPAKKPEFKRCCCNGHVANTQCDKNDKEQQGPAENERGGTADDAFRCNMDCQQGTLADTECCRPQGQRELGQSLHPETIGKGQADRFDYDCAGDWQNGIWIECPDRKQRLVEPSIRLLVDGFSSRRPILHGFGNAIVPQVAAQFIKAAAK